MISTFVTVFVAVLLSLLGYVKTYDGENIKAAYSLDLSTIPAFKDKPYVEVNHNQPCFSEKEKSKDSFEVYSQLDALGRCGVAFANVGIDLMPIEERGAIGFVKPSGWHIAKYEFDTDSCRWNYIGTTEELNIKKEEEKYASSPIVKAIKVMLDRNNGS